MGADAGAGMRLRQPRANGFGSERGNGLRRAEQRNAYAARDARTFFPRMSSSTRLGLMYVLQDPHAAALRSSATPATVHLCGVGESPVRRFSFWVGSPGSCRANGGSRK
jgi:hypothetical protein